MKDTDARYLPVNLRKQGVDSTAINKKGVLSERYYPVYYNEEDNSLWPVLKSNNKIIPIDSGGEKEYGGGQKEDAEKNDSARRYLVK